MANGQDGWIEVKGLVPTTSKTSPWNFRRNCRHFWRVRIGNQSCFRHPLCRRPAPVRRSLSSYARQFIGQMKKPIVIQLKVYLPPFPSINKAVTIRSTVATVTDTDYLRLLWARIGKPHCPTCGKEVARRTVQEIVDDIFWRMEAHGVAVWSPVVRARKGTHVELFRQLVEQGYLHGRVNGHAASFEDPPTLDKNFRHDIDVRIDRLRCTRDRKQRLTEAVESALRLGGGTLAVESLEAPDNDAELSENSNAHATQQGQTIAWSEDFACPEHGAFMPELSPWPSVQLSARCMRNLSGVGRSASVQRGPHRRRQHERLERLRDTPAPIHVTLLVRNSSSASSITASQRRFRLRCWMRMRKTSSSTVQDRPSFITIHLRKRFSIQVQQTVEGIVPRLEKTYAETTSHRTCNRLISCMTVLIVRTATVSQSCCTIRNGRGRPPPKSASARSTMRSDSSEHGTPKATVHRKPSKIFLKRSTSEACSSAQRSSKRLRDVLASSTALGWTTSPWIKPTPSQAVRVSEYAWPPKSAVV